MPVYKVQGLKLLAIDIEEARQLSGFAYIAIRFAEGSDNKLEVQDVFAADGDKNRIGGIIFKRLNESPVQLRQDWIKDHLYLISNDMLEEVSSKLRPPKEISVMEFTAKPQPFSHGGKDYVSFNVKTKHK